MLMILCLGAEHPTSRSRDSWVSHLLAGLRLDNLQEWPSGSGFCVCRRGSPLLFLLPSLTPLKIYWAGPPHLTGLC